MKSQFTINLASNLVSFAFSLLVSVWFTPYLISNLGVDSYGLIPLAITATSYLSLFTVALQSTVGRFLTIAINQNDEAKANRIFNTSFWSTVGILLLILLPCLLMAFNAERLFEVPKGSGKDLVLLFLSTIAVFFLATLSSIFSVSSFCKNRFDLSNGVNILSTVVRVATVVILFNLCRPRVWHVGIALLLAAFIASIASVEIWRRLTPMLRLHLSFFSMASLRAMLWAGTWIMINMIGSLLYLSIDLIVVNKILGPEATGKYGAIMTWSALLRGLGGALGGVFGPTIVVLHARADMEGLMRYARTAVKFLGLMLAIPIGLICGMSKPLLLLWLGKHFSPLAPLMSVMTIHLCVNLAVLPLFNVQVATNRVRVPGIVTCIMGFMNLALAVLLAGPVGWGMYGVAAAGAIMLTCKNLIFTPIYAARILKVKWNSFLTEIIPIVGVTLIVATIGHLLANHANINSWVKLAGAGTVVTAMAALLVFATLLTREERLQALRLLTPWRRETGA